MTLFQLGIYLHRIQDPLTVLLSHTLTNAPSRTSHPMHFLIILPLLALIMLSMIFLNEDAKDCVKVLDLFLGEISHCMIKSSQGLILELGNLV